MATVAVNPLTMRTELATRIEQIARARHLPAAELCHRVDAVRHLAVSGRLLPLARLAGALRDAVAGGARGTTVAAWVEAMRDSLRTEAQDEATARAFVASVGVRLAG